MYGGFFMIKNVLIDLDDTILDFKKAERLAVKRTLEELSIPANEAVLSRYSEINASQWLLLENGSITRDELKPRRFRLLFKELAVETDAKKATIIYEGFLADGHFFKKGAEALLEALYKKYRLYLASNGTARVQTSRIKSAGLEKYFDGICISELIGANKPDAAFFEHIFSGIPGFKKSETVIIGDSLSSDISGGKNAGIKTIWFNENGLVSTLPDFTVKSLEEIPPLLVSL